MCLLAHIKEREICKTSLSMLLLCKIVYFFKLLKKRLYLLTWQWIITYLSILLTRQLLSRRPDNFTEWLDSDVEYSWAITSKFTRHSCRVYQVYSTQILSGI